MKRDMELVRDLLLKISEADGPLNFSETLRPDSDDNARAVAEYHMAMLVDEVGFVRGIDASSMDGRDWIDLVLTWHGQDFLDSVRDPTVWAKTRDGVKKLGGVTFEMFIGIAKEVAKAEVKKRLNLDL